MFLHYISAKLIESITNFWKFTLMFESRSLNSYEIQADVSAPIDQRHVLNEAGQPIKNYQDS
jgi:hypothetical protein